MIWLFIGGRHRHPKSDAFSRSGHGAHNCQWFIHRPLRPRDLRCVQIPIVDVVASQNVSDEDTMDLGLFQQLCKLNPVVDIPKLRRAVVRVAPESGRLMATT